MSDITTRSVATRLLVALAVVAGVVATTPRASTAAGVINVPGDFATIQAAINAAVDGDRILVAPGTYVENLDFLGKDVVVKSTDGPAATTVVPAQGAVTIKWTSGEPTTATIDGFTFARPDHWWPATLVADGGNGRFINNVVDGVGGLWIDNAEVDITGNRFLSPGSRPDGSILVVDAESSSIAFRNNSFSGPPPTEGSRITLVRIAGRDEPNLYAEVTGNSIIGVAGSALSIRGIDSPVVRNNVIVGNLPESRSAVTIIGAAPMVENNLFAHNGDPRAGLGTITEVDFRGTEGGAFRHNTVVERVQEDSDDRRPVRLRGPEATIAANNVFSGRNRFAIVECGTATTVRFNTFWNPKGKELTGGCSTIGSNGNAVADPLFIEPDGWDFRPAPSSPVVDAGRPADSTPGDVDGNPRPVDGDFDGVAKSDRGAYEIPGTLITGRVSSSGTARANICVSAYSTDVKLEAKTRTDANGTYRLTAAPGSHLVHYEDCVDGLVASEWFDDAPAAAGATTVFVPERTNATGVDADLAPAVSCNGVQATIVGTHGDDTLLGTPSDDVIVALGGDDRINSRRGHDRICADGGDDTVNAGRGRDEVFAGDGHDVILGSPGKDAIHGGNGDDLIDLSAAPVAVTVRLGKGTIRGWGGRTVTEVEDVVGSAYGDTLIGTAANNKLRGGAGDDFISPKGGYDEVWGEDGDDTITTGLGTNDLDGGAGDDFFVARGSGWNDISGREGVDAVSYASLTEGITIKGLVERPNGRDDIASVEIVEATAFADWIDITGLSQEEPLFVFAGAGNDTVRGGNRDDAYIDGGSGDDTLDTDSGYHILVGGPGNDLLRSRSSGGLMAPGRGIDAVEGSDHPDDAVTYELEPSAVAVDLGFGSGTWQGGTAALTSIDHVIGTNHDDTLVGNAGMNILIGLEGADELHGRGGNDILDGSEGVDTLNGGAGDDHCYNGETHNGCEHQGELGPPVAALLESAGWVTSGSEAIRAIAMRHTLYDLVQSLGDRLSTPAPIPRAAR